MAVAHVQGVFYCWDSLLILSVSHGCFSEFGVGYFLRLWGADPLRLELLRLA